MNIVLVGARGAGKSRLARTLCQVTKRPVLSTDLLISYDNDGRSIPEIVAAHGWRGFREMEYAVVQKVARLDGGIVDCGGGVVVELDETGQEVFSARKVDLLRDNGFVVWLQGDPARLAAAVMRDPNRPALSSAASEEEIMRRRAPFYEQAAHLTLDILRLHDKEMQCMEILRAMERA